MDPVEAKAAFSLLCGSKRSFEKSKKIAKKFENSEFPV